MKKLLSSILVGVMLLSLVACGGKGNDKYAGKWISVAGTAMGVTLTGEDIAGFELDLKSGGKGTMTVDGDSTNIKWENDDSSLTVKVEGEELVATIDEDTLVFEDFLGLGMDLTFAKEGSDAANPENFLSENEKKMVGTWSSYKVTDVLDDDASGEVAPDALKMTFKEDHTVDIEFRGESIEGQQWTLFDTFGTITEEGEAFSWEIEGEEIKVTYNGEEYWIFACKK